MRCDQFQNRMDLLLDQRQDLDRDVLLRSHAETCPSCRSRLSAWSTIDEIVSSSDSAISVDPTRQLGAASAPTPMLTTGAWTGAAWAIAALVLVCVAMTPWITPNTPTDGRGATGAIVATEPNPMAVPPAEIDSLASADSLATTDSLAWQSEQWWNAMSDDHWVSQTLPAVNSVRIGVAPIGRSMKQAFAILMIQSDRTTMETPVISPEIQPKPDQEQTSTDDPSQNLLAFA